ncbi:MAG TPA: ChaN family lipoprotein, partial [Burkholderiales bacterium]|nr:ChaN family lipoprotein [Burkholderiales bacterium]
MVVTAAELFAQATQPRNTLLDDHPLVGKIWDTASARFVGRDALVDALMRAHFRLLGEIHDNPVHHTLQAELLEAIAASGLKPLVAFEQMDREHDAALQQRLTQEKTQSEDVADAVRFDRTGWTWTYYRPLVEIALRFGLPLRAANLSRKAAAQIAREGLSAITPTRIAELRLEGAWSPEREQAMREIIRHGHCGALPESAVPSMVAAQRVRDATLAESLLTSSKDGAVLIAGNGHVRRDLGVPLYLAASAARTACSVGVVEVEAGHLDPLSYVVAMTSHAPLYDFVCFTARRERPD